MSTPIPAAIAAQLSAARGVLERHLGGTLHAIHLFGSAVDGGLRPRSDIDLLVSVREPLADGVRGRLMTDLLQVSAWPGTDPSLRALEVTLLVLGEVVPWRYRPMRELQFGEWLRADVAAGIFEPAMPDHDLAILLTKARAHSVALHGPAAADLFAPVPRADVARAMADTVAQWNDTPDWQGEEGHIVLALARIWFTAHTGAIASKDSAATWALARLPEQFHPVLAAARSAYLTGAADALGTMAQPVREFILHMKSRIAADGLATP